MKRGSNTSIPERVAEMSIPELIRTILVLLALITVLVLIAILIGQHADEEIGWIAWVGVVGLQRSR